MTIRTDGTLQLSSNDAQVDVSRSKLHMKAECVVFALRMGGEIPVAGRSEELASFFEALATILRMADNPDEQTIVLRGVPPNREIPF